MQRPYLIGTHVYLRPLEPADASRFASWLNDTRVTRTLRYRRPITDADELAFIEGPGKDNGDVRLGIVLKRGDRLIGSAGLMRVDWQARSAGYGIHIGMPSEWGKGYGTEVTRMIVAHAFDSMNLNRVWLEVHVTNLSAIHAYEQAGFRHEGTQRQAVYREGGYRDMLMMAILREEWEAARKPSAPGSAKARTRRKKA